MNEKKKNEKKWKEKNDQKNVGKNSYEEGKKGRKGRSFFLYELNCCKFCHPYDEHDSCLYECVADKLVVEDRWRYIVEKIMESVAASP